MDTKNTLISALLLILSMNSLMAQQQLDKTLLHDGETREYTVIYQQAIKALRPYQYYLIFMEDQGILPHPAADYMTTEMDFIGYLIYHIYSAIGKHLVSGVINSVNKTIDLSGLRANIYFLKLDDKVLKVIKAK